MCYINNGTNFGVWNLWMRSEHTKEGLWPCTVCFEFRINFYIIIFLLKFSNDTYFCLGHLSIKFLRNLRWSKLIKYLLLGHLHEETDQMHHMKTNWKISNPLYFCYSAIFLKWWETDFEMNSSDTRVPSSRNTSQCICCLCIKAGVIMMSWIWIQHSAYHNHIYNSHWGR